MSVHYLVNFVATLANVAGAGSSIDLPVAILMSEGGFIPAELREALTKEWLRLVKRDIRWIGTYDSC